MRFLENYFAHSRLFLAAHLGIWCIAIVLFCLLERDRRRLSRSAAGESGVTEAQFKKLTAPLARYDLYFDLCSSAFILIGLIGTIYGFASAIPNLTNEGYDFHEFGNALSTSAFGIIWSLLLNALLALYHILLTDRTVERLRQYQTIEDLGETIARNMQQIGAEFVPHIKASLERFAAASIDLAGATKQLVTASHESAAGFRDVATKTAETATKVDQVLRKATKLPEALTSRLENLFRSASDSMSLSAGKLTTALGELEGIPEQLQRRLESAFAGQLDQLQAAGDRLQMLHERLLQESFAHSTQLTNAFLEALTHVSQEVSSLPAVISRETVAALRSINTETEQVAGRLSTSLLAIEKLPIEFQRRTEETFQAQVVALKGAQEEMSTSEQRLFQQWATRLDSAVNAFSDSIVRAEGMPEAIAGQIRTLVDTYRKILEEQHISMTEELRRVGTSIVRDQLESLKEATGDQKRQAERLAETLDIVYSDERRKLHEAIHLALSDAVHWVEDFRKQFEQVQRDLPDEMKRGQVQLIEGTHKASQSLIEVAATLGVEAQDVHRVLAQVNASMAEFRSVVDGLSQVVTNFRPIGGVAASQAAMPQPYQAPQPFVSRPHDTSQRADPVLPTVPRAVEKVDATVSDTPMERNAHRGLFGWFGKRRSD